MTAPLWPNISIKRSNLTGADQWLSTNLFTSLWAYTITSKLISLFEKSRFITPSADKSTFQFCTLHTLCRWLPFSLVINTCQSQVFSPRTLSPRQSYYTNYFNLSLFHLDKVFRVRPGISSLPKLLCVRALAWQNHPGTWRGACVENGRRGRVVRSRRVF